MMDSETNSTPNDEPLIFDEAHADETHKRWIKLRNNLKIGYELNYTAEDGYLPDDWYNNQCGQCRYYIPLQGKFASDWGACSNAASEFDGHVMFEHDGCDNYSGANEWVSSYMYLLEKSASEVE